MKRRIMKKAYRFLLTILMAASVLPSCGNLLDPEPFGYVDIDLVWTKYNYTKSYIDLINSPEWGGDFSFANICDEGQNVRDRSTSMFQQWYTTDFNADEFPLTMNYASLYSDIRTCNFFLENYQKINYLGLDQEELEYWIAKCHVYRAWDHLTLMKYLGHAVIMDEFYSLTHDFTQDHMATTEELADYIIKELDTALETPECESSVNGFRWQLGANDQGVVNRGFAWVLKARTALYAASPLYYEEGSKYTWDYAYEICAEALHQLMIHNHQLFDINPDQSEAQNAYEYYHIYPSGDFARTVDQETILSKVYTLNMWQQNGLPITEGQVNCGVCPTQEFVDSFETIDGEPILDLEKPYLDDQHLVPNYNKNNKLYDPENPYENRDPRFYATVYYNGCYRYPDKAEKLQVWTYDGGNCAISESPILVSNTRTGYYLRKYNHPQSNENQTLDGRVQPARLAEMYLNLAEAACEAGHLDEAIEAVNTVRHRAGMPNLPETLTQDQLRLRIRNERRVELCFENIRFFDVRRWKIIDQTEEQMTGMRITKNSDGSFKYERFAFDKRVNKGDDKYLLFPFDEAEIEKLKTTLGQDYQNPGW